ncbi:MAG: Rrf2 family transcriptional regulator [Planctomycetota bacterium]
MLVSQKDQYALQAVLELAKRHGRGPVKVSAIAEAQSIPARFLEVILNELKQSGFLASRRGKRGGYFLLVSPEELSVGDVISSVQGPMRVAAPRTSASHSFPSDDGVLQSLWKRVEQAISGICDSTTFADLVEQERLEVGMRVPTYAI